MGGPPRDKLLSTLGLCARAGGLIYGTDLVCEALRRGIRNKTPLMVIVASDASANTRKKINDKCKYYGVRAVLIPHTAAEMGASLGRPGAIAAAGVTDRQLCRALEGQLGGCGEGRFEG